MFLSNHPVCHHSDDKTQRQLLWGAQQHRGWILQPGVYSRGKGKSRTYSRVNMCQWLAETQVGREMGFVCICDVQGRVEGKEARTGKNSWHADLTSCGVSGVLVTVHSQLLRGGVRGKRRGWFVASASFRAAITPIVTDFMLPMWCYWTWSISLCLTTGSEFLNV